VVPRPIAWVSTVASDGVLNLAPFSFFNAFGAAPVVLGFAPMYAGGQSQKDTLNNVRATKQFVINIATEATLAHMDATGKRFPPEIDEFAEAGLTPQPSTAVLPPRVAESPISFECELFSLVPLGEGEGSATLVLGRAVYLHIRDDVMRDGTVDAGLLRPVARMGDPFYARPEALTFRRSDR
jgi:flavin reductase (DIM6/NTAB) family NADH-FMN oxidoreductase RutF